MTTNRNSKSTAAAPAAAAFLPVPVALRHDGWTPAKQAEFIEALADTGVVKAAAARIGMTEQSAHRLRRRADAASFDAAWEAALEIGIQRLVSVALERALEGSVKRTYYHGELVGEERVHSEKLLLWLLEKGRHMLRRSNERDAIGEDWEGSIAAIGEGVARATRYRVWRNRQGYWLTNFPPPEDFDDYSSGNPGSEKYERMLTGEEQAANPLQDAEDDAIEAAYERHFNWSGVK